MNNKEGYISSDCSFPLGEAAAWGNVLGKIKVLDILAFLAPVTQFIEIKVVGRLFMPDVLLACMLPMLFFAHGKRLRARLPMIFILLTFSWLICQMATDIVRETAFNDYARGWAKIVFTLFNFCTLYLLLYGHRRRLILYAVGLAAGGMISYFVRPSLYAADFPWKFGYGEPTTWFLVLLAAAAVGNRRLGNFVASGILIGAAALNIYMGYRSLGGVCFLAASYLFFQDRLGQRLSDIRKKPLQVLLIGMALVAVGIGAFEMYDYTARSGLLGADAQEKHQLQAFGEYGLLLGGRSEVLVSSRAILDSPVLGHGSWAKDYEYSSLLNEIRQQAGYVAGEEDEEGLIPTHSHLLGAWVEAGLLGAVFWMWVLSLPIRVLLRPHSVMERLTPLLVFFAFLLVWDVFFSPYGAERRFVTPYYVVVMMTCLGAYRGIFRQWISQ